MSDLYQQLNVNREVTPRTQDGFLQKTNESQPTTTSKNTTITSPNEKDKQHSEEDILSHEDKTPDYLIETAKSKLLTLEVSLRQQLEQHLFDNPDISWDTFIEAALILCLKNPSQTQRATKLAAERLSDRKRSAVYKRTQTMAKKFI